MRPPWSVTRNSTVAALARILCVVEARKTGGSIQTAHKALSMGRPVLYQGGGGEAPVFAGNALAKPLQEPGAEAFNEQLKRAWCAAPVTRARQLELL